jgi:predicted transcriptional regulator
MLSNSKLKVNKVKPGEINFMANRIDKESLKELHDQGVRSVDIAKKMCVSQAAVCKMLKKMGLAITAVSTMEMAPKIVKRQLNAVDQLQKINDYANELLDLVMRWNRGEEVALQLLESQAKMVRVGQGKDVEWIREFKFKDPREIALKAMLEIRGQLTLQLEIFKTLYGAESQQEFQTEVLDVIGEIDPNARAKILRQLNQRRLVRESFSPC